MRRRYRSHLPPVYVARNLFNTPGARTSNPPVVNRAEAPGAGAPVQPRLVDPPRQNNVLSRHVSTPPGHYSNPLDNIVAAASRLAALPVKGESPVEVETRRTRELLQTALTQQQAYSYSRERIHSTPAQAEVIAGILMNRLFQAVRGTIIRLVGITRRAVVLMLRTWWITVEHVERPS